MTELSFTKQFLATLATRPVRFPPDFCKDPRTLPAQTPYTLPRTRKPLTKRARLEPSAVPTATITLKSLRGSTISVSLPETPLTTTVSTLKLRLSTETKFPIEKLKLLIKGKVLGDLKTLEDVGIKAGEDVTVNVMVMGGTSAAASPAASPPMPQEEEVKEVVEEKRKVLAEDSFWQELRGFLNDKLGENSHESPEAVLGVFQNAWKKEN
ncbi:hypothetical protein RUND412_000841 [Rhizina undulata]